MRQDAGGCCASTDGRDTAGRTEGIQHRGQLELLVRGEVVNLTPPPDGSERPHYGMRDGGGVSESVG